MRKISSWEIEFFLTRNGRSDKIVTMLHFIYKMGIPDMKSPEKILEGHGFNCTDMQVATLDILIQAERPVSRDDIWKALGVNKSDKTTLYRILERFCEKDLVHKAYVDKRAWEYELADKCTDHQCHPHFKCTNCGKVTCLHDVHVPLIEGLKKEFVFQRQKIMIEGIGPECSTLFCDK